MQNFNEGDICRSLGICGRGGRKSKTVTETQTNTGQCWLSGRRPRWLARRQSNKSDRNKAKGRCCLLSSFDMLGLRSAFCICLRHNSILSCDYRWRVFGSGRLNNLTMQGQIPSELQLPDLGGWQKVKESEGQHVGIAVSIVSLRIHWDLLGSSLKLQFLRPQLKSTKLESPRDGNPGSSF